MVAPVEVVMYKTANIAVRIFFIPKYLNKSKTNLLHQVVNFSENEYFITEH